MKLDTDGLSSQDTALATAIHRTVLQRWITLEYLLNRVLTKPMQDLEPTMQAVLLTGAAQLVFMHRLPRHAVVDEQVKLARQMVRPGAAGLANAVLRKVAGMVGELKVNEPWFPAEDRLPLEGGTVVLTEPCLPPTRQAMRHLAVATSHPRALIQRWISAFGREKAELFCLHGSETPPTIVAVEPGFVAEEDTRYQPHQAPGYLIWQGTKNELRQFLAQHPARRVQDPASARPVASTAKLKVERIMDYCAGRGTKTRQLAALHPKARIWATDVDPQRRSALKRATEGLGQVKVFLPDQPPEQPMGLMVLDVPCSNTGVLARRPEARYRFDARSLASLTDLQRQIARHSVEWVRPGGFILYSTCSLEREENHEQAVWLSHLVRGQVVHESLVEPAGSETTYQDGGYHALIQLPG
ncbi:MAG: hypothetical protein D6800_15070 [Candidatus Zixiibacteriota bacterium]|nr:MAG: hypothetical protein D6800_15070 [candidate division Zixibacteria bacterium]